MLKPLMLALALAAPVGLAGCGIGGGAHKTDYVQLNPQQTANWKVVGVRVSVPETLTTTEENSFVPNADIVWHGEVPGDRRAQVGRIMSEGLTAGSKVVNGKTPVILNATVQHFHASTKAALYNPYGLGVVENLTYTIFVTDQAGKQLTEPQQIRGDFPAITGAQADIENARGNTERVQYVNHIKNITSHWLGYGADPRMTFSSPGR